MRDVSFDVDAGKVLGVIGRNGAGKSTLLKMLSRITEPSTGRIELRGRVASLLEVGTGFHPELTGRENVFLNGAILGMSRREIAEKFDEIVAFAEIERFLDTPVKRYSSGMYTRLAFAVAAHLEPDILLVDEVLAVGDAQFQRKCIGKMGEVARASRTILFVSHNMVAVESLCDKVIWLDGGRLVEEGPTKQVITSYLRHSFSQLAEQTWDDPETAPGGAEARLRRVAVRPETGPADGAITIRTPVAIEVEYWNLVPGAQLTVSVFISNDWGVLVMWSAAIRERNWYGQPLPVGLFRSVCHLPGDLLNDGMHRVEVQFNSDENTFLFKHPDALAFDVRDVADMRGTWFGRWPGAVRPDLQWETDLIAPASPEASVADP